MTRPCHNTNVQDLNIKCCVASAGYKNNKHGMVAVNQSETELLRILLAMFFPHKNNCITRWSRGMLSGLFAILPQAPPKILQSKGKKEMVLKS